MPWSGRWVGWVQCKPGTYPVCPLPAAPGEDTAGRAESEHRSRTCSSVASFAWRGRSVWPAVRQDGRFASHGLDLLALLVCASYGHKMVSSAMVSPHLLCKAQLNIPTAEFLSSQSLHFYHKKHSARLLVRGACCWVREIQTNTDKWSTLIHHRSKHSSRLLSC